MIYFIFILVAFTASLGVFAAPQAGKELSLRSGTASSTGASNGFYYSYWTDNGAAATYTNGAGGRYTLTWGTGGNLVGGKGWMPGSAM